VIIKQSVLSKFSLLKQTCQATVIVLLTFLISACQLFQSQRSTGISPDSLQKIKNWTARGKMMVADNKERVSGYFYWQQNGRDFSFSLDTIIGTNLFSLEYKDGISIVKADGKQYKGSDPQTLIYKLTGHQLPISNMPNWLLGKVGEDVINPNYDQNQRITSFNYQANFKTWLINYVNWEPRPPLFLPKTLNLSTDTNRVKISVSSWHIEG